MENPSLLEQLRLPGDIKDLSLDQLNELCDEIRNKIINTVSKNGGHLASNLGVVELTVALHYVFDLPQDQIVWDVGHQCYTHKILTGRLDQISTIRKENGLSGFPKRCESIYDSFNAGHSSTSISAAFGIASAKSITGDQSKTIAVIGDGALSGGLAYEGLNNAGRFKKNFIVILNDNNMSISRNVGSMARYLAEIRMKPGYIKIKERVEAILNHIPVVGGHIRNFLQSSKSALKNMIYKSTLFEDMGFLYYGPVDGHDMKKLISVFRLAKQSTKPILIHLKTKKGKGYSFAEQNPKDFHGISAFDIETGEPLSGGSDGFSGVFGQVLCDFARDDQRICAITAAMKIGTGLSEFSHLYRERFFDVGIAEGHAVTFAAGLAAGGMLPVFAVYSTFLQRSYDQIIHDAAMQHMKVVLAIDRAGLVGEDGETHQGVFDTAFLNEIPEVTVFSPSYFQEIKPSLQKALYGCSGVAAVRYPRGGEGYRPAGFLSSGGAFDVWGDPKAELMLVTYGRLFSYACHAKEALHKLGIEICILKLNQIKPIETECISLCLEKRRVFFFEEGILNGGIGETFGYLLQKNHYPGEFYLNAIEQGILICSTGGQLVQRIDHLNDVVHMPLGQNQAQVAGGCIQSGLGEALTQTMLVGTNALNEVAKPLHQYAAAQHITQGGNVLAIGIGLLKGGGKAVGNQQSKVGILTAKGRIGIGMAIYRNQTVNIFRYDMTIGIHAEGTDLIVILLGAVNQLGLIDNAGDMLKDFCGKLYTNAQIHLIVDQGKL